MSLSYLILGIPQNLGEFADKAARKGDTSVDITLERETGLDGLYQHYHLLFRSEHSRVRVAEKGWYRLFYVSGSDNINGEARELSREAASYLRRCGFDVTNIVAGN